MPNDLTDEIYLASLAAEIRALRDLPFASREAAAYALDANGTGFIIDRQIMIWGWDAGLVMGMRARYGYTWVPSAFQPSLVDPFNLLGGFHTDMTHPWARSITVSTDAAKFPAFSQQTTPAVPLPKIVGGPDGNGRFIANLQTTNDHGRWLYNPGQAYPFDATQAEVPGTYIFDLLPTPWGPEPGWKQ